MRQTVRARPFLVDLHFLEGADVFFKRSEMSSTTGFRKDWLVGNLETPETLKMPCELDCLTVVIFESLDFILDFI